MPTRKLPTTEESRVNALTAGKERKDMIPAPPVIPYTTGTASWLDTFYPLYKAKVDALATALQTQTSVSAQVRENKFLAEIFISHFFLALQSAILRKTFPPEARSFYGIAVHDRKVPVISSEADIDFWNNKATIGEAARIAAGGAPVTFPSIAEVNTAVTNFKTSNLLQANAKDLFDIAQEAVEADNPECDRLILKMWNETETTFDTGNKPSMRRKAREWGVIYVPRPGETPSPDDFSLMGTITDSATGEPLADATVNVAEANVTVQTDSHGKYFVQVINPGTYTVTAVKTGYQDHQNNGVSVVAGAITTLNFQLIAVPATGSIHGTAKQSGTGVPSIITVQGTGLSTNTDPLGNFSLSGIPAGSQTIRATKQGTSEFQEVTITIAAGSDTEVNFVFP